MSPGKRANRREFLAGSTAAGVGVAAGASILAGAKPARAAPASEKIVLAMVGIRGRGKSLMQGFAKRNDCEIAYLADVDTRLFGSRVGWLQKKTGKAPKTEQDFRRVLDDKSVDAIVVATPDHWHALATIWGAEAKKHVYVEKPPSHNVWEGRKMVEAARRNKVVVQAGTQNRSAAYNKKAKEYITSGKLGKIHLCRVYNQKFMRNRQPVADAETPPELNWDMWNGPAPAAKYNWGVHRGWHNYWRYSGGDAANDGVHQLDLARWLIGVDYPQTVYCVGHGHYDQGADETPCTQIATYEFGDVVMTFEMTEYTPYMLKTDGKVRKSDMFPYWPQNATRIELFGEKGLMVVGRHGGGWQVFERTRARQPVVTQQMFGRFPDDEHKANFCESIRSGKLPNADIEQGHRTALLVHYANISYRTGGEKLVIDKKTEGFTGGSKQATALLTRSYRKPWAIKE